MTIMYCGRVSDRSPRALNVSKCQISSNQIHRHGFYCVHLKFTYTVPFFSLSFSCLFDFGGGQVMGLILTIVIGSPVSCCHRCFSAFSLFGLKNKNVQICLRYIFKFQEIYLELCLIILPDWKSIC